MAQRTRPWRPGRAGGEGACGSRPRRSGRGEREQGGGATDRRWRGKRVEGKVHVALWRYQLRAEGRWEKGEGACDWKCCNVTVNGERVRVCVGVCEREHGRGGPHGAALRLCGERAMFPTRGRWQSARQTQRRWRRRGARRRGADDAPLASLRVGEGERRRRKRSKETVGSGGV